MSHPPLNMTGQKLINGKMTICVFTADDIKDWIIDKMGLDASSVKMRGSSISSVVTHFNSGQGKPTSGKNKHVPHVGFKTPVVTHTSKYRGSDVYHTSSGTPGVGNGVSMFYVNAQGNDGKIIGLGHHVNSTTYVIEWNVSDWHVGRVVTLS